MFRGFWAESDLCATVRLAAVSCPVSRGASLALTRRRRRSRRARHPRWPLLFSESSLDVRTGRPPKRMPKRNMGREAARSARTRRRPARARRSRHRVYQGKVGNRRAEINQVMAVTGSELRPTRRGPTRTVDLHTLPLSQRLDQDSLQSLRVTKIISFIIRARLASSRHHACAYHASAIIHESGYRDRPPLCQRVVADAHRRFTNLATLASARSRLL